MKNLSLNLAMLAALAAAGATGCSKVAPSVPKGPTSENLVVAGQDDLRRQIGDVDNHFTVLGTGAVKFLLRSGQLNAGSSQEALKALSDAGSLQVALPRTLFNQHQVLGAVITQVSDHENEDMGNLKLTDLPALHVRGVVSTRDGGKFLDLVGCEEKCTETSEQKTIFSLPITGEEPGGQAIVVDLASVGKDFNLVSLLDPDGEGLQLKTKLARTVRVDYDLSTLVFDVESHLIPLDASVDDPQAPVTVITSRWYLKLASAFNPAFVSREATPGVGFFMTGRGTTDHITRFSLEQTGPGAPVKYFVKNVPTRYRDSFAGAFDEWNAKLSPVFGHAIVEYEFVEKEDPRYPLLVPGDVRYNIVEWDLDNKASYGGLGPSIANQMTGETFSANVLVQGPTIEVLYKAWFGANDQAQQLRAMGQVAAAEQVLKSAQHELQSKVDELKSRRFTLKTGRGTEFRVVSQLQSLEDPVMEPSKDFEELPAGISYDAYMAGYFHDMLAHELGHNLGLRHNFRGNMGALQGPGETPKTGEVSRSVMEYLGRGFRYQDHIGEYDVMALTYGYLGTKPGHTDWFCTDEDSLAAGTKNSAECSPDDATSDPFGFFELRLKHAVDLTTAAGQPGAPVWTVKELRAKLDVAVNGLSAYAATATDTSSGWTGFFGKPGRPSQADGVHAYVASRMNQLICQADIDAAIAQKPVAQDREKAQAGLEELRAAVLETAATWQVFQPGEVGCAP